MRLSVEYAFLCIYPGPGDNVDFKLLILGLNVFPSRHLSMTNLSPYFAQEVGRLVSSPRPMPS